MRGIVLGGALLILVLGGVLTVASLDMKPTVQKVEINVPDDRLPH